MPSALVKKIIQLCEDCSPSELDEVEWGIGLLKRGSVEREIAPDILRVHDREDDEATVAMARECQALLRSKIGLTQAEQGLLAAVVLRDLYDSASFGSRRINNVIEEAGRKRIANITSALSGVIAKQYLIETDKLLVLTEAGRSKAEALLHLKWDGEAGENAA